MELTLNTVPAILVAAVMVYTGIIWLITRNMEIRMDTRIIAYTLILEGIVYGLYGQFGDYTLLERVLKIRLVTIIVCLSQSVPLTVSYLRSIKRGNA